MRSVKDAQKGKLPLQARSKAHARRMEQVSPKHLFAKVAWPKLVAFLEAGRRRSSAH